MRIIDFKKKKMELLAKKHQESYGNANICCICKEKVEDKHIKDTKYREITDHYHYTGEYRGAARTICDLKYIISKKITKNVYNVSDYGYHCIRKTVCKRI